MGIIDMPLNNELQLVLDFGTGHSLFPTGLVLWIHSPSQERMLFITVTARSEITGQTKVIVKSHMHRSELEHADFVLCRLPITPSLRELYRMFMVTFEFGPSETEGDLIYSKLAEIEFFGDYLPSLLPEVLSIAPQPFHFRDEYMIYSRGD